MGEHKHSIVAAGDAYCEDCDDVAIDRGLMGEVFSELLAGRLVQLRGLHEREYTVRSIEVTRGEMVESQPGVK